MLIEGQAGEGAYLLVNLLELQQRMSKDVMRPLTSDFQMQPVTTDGRSTQEIADSYIKPNNLLSSFDRLEIYNRQYWFRVIGAVAEDFPALSTVLGGKVFNLLVLAYLRENPSTSFTLRNLGSKLPQWLEEHSEVLLLGGINFCWTWQGWSGRTLRPSIGLRSPL